MPIRMRGRIKWDPVVMQTEQVTPAGSHSFLLEWHIDPPDDPVLPPEAAKAIAQVLTDLGLVAFRWREAPDWEPEDAYIVSAPPRPVFRRLTERVAGGSPPDIVVTRSPDVAAKLFEADWESQGQAAFVLAPSGENAEPALATLMTRHDWRGLALAPPILLFLAPVVGGQGALLSINSEDQVEALSLALSRSLDAAGIRLDP